MAWQARRWRIAWLVARLSAGAALGVAPGVLYAGLVGLVHRAVYGHWDRVPAFATACVLAGALIGLLLGIASALGTDAAPVRAPAARTARRARRSISPRIFQRRIRRPEATRRWERPAHRARFGRGW